MTCLIIGEAGSVGRNLTLSLLEKGHWVRVLDRNTGVLRRVVNERLQLMEGGVEDRSQARKAVEGIEVIVHLAWFFSENPLELLETDVKGHINPKKRWKLLRSLISFSPAPPWYTANLCICPLSRRLPVWLRMRENLFTESQSLWRKN